MDITSNLRATPTLLASGNGAATNILLASKKNNTLSTSGNLKESQSDTNTIVDEFVSSLSPDEQAKLKKKQADAAQVIETMRNAQTQASDEKKGQAAEKIARIKAQLQMLRMMAAINPKAAARQAAQLSRELQAAVREYSDGANAGSSSVLGGGSSAPVIAGSGAVTTAKEVEGSVDGAAVGASTVPGAGTAASIESVPKAQGDEDGQAQAVGVPQTDAQKKQAEDDQKQADRDQNLQGLREQMAQIEQRVAKANADREFTKNAREVAAQLKSIIQQAKNKLQAEKGDQQEVSDLKIGENALREAEQTLGQLDANATTVIAVANTAVATSVDVTV